MPRKKRCREIENPPKETGFRMRGKLVNPKAIVKFTKRVKVGEPSMISDSSVSGTTTQ